MKTKIRPIFVEELLQVPQPEGAQIKGGLSLESRDGCAQGRRNGPAVVPGDPEKSLLIKAVRYTDQDLQMPPKGQKLSDDQIADLEAWVKMGAPDPRGGELRRPTE